MAAIIPVEEIRKFYNENRLSLQKEYRLVANQDDAGIEIYLTEENACPCFIVEMDGSIEYEASASSDLEIEKVYTQLLNLYICEEESDFSVDDLERIDEINFATCDYLSTLLECDPENCLDENDIEEISSLVEEILYNEYGLSVRHPTVDGERVIQYPYSEEVE